MLDQEMTQSDLSYEYRVGGTLEPDHPTYVERAADQRLYHLLKVGEFCYVLNSRQMGKSSLVVHTRKKLEAENFSFAIIDLSALGAEIKSIDQWYTTILYNLQESFHLDEVDLGQWWQHHESLTPSARLGKFIESFLLSRQTQQKFIIVIDEIDYILKLKLKLQQNTVDNPSTDDFFAFIRSCYNQRTSKRDYERLTFVLIGVATPYDLIANPDCTPFNIGQEIKLYGFRAAEVKPLEKGLVNQVEQPETVLQEILYWTGGQPFLTQKLCNLILKMDQKIAAGDEARAVEGLVRAQVIKTWGQKDQPAHFGVIRDRILKNRRSPSRLLTLYQQILEQGEIQENRENLEQLELKLSGLVMEQEGRLRVYNSIYQEIFNQQWIQQELTKLRPYGEAINAWIVSDYSDNSRLLHGKALQDALGWAEAQRSIGEVLSEDDQRFLETSQAFEQIARAKPEVADLLRKFWPQLQQIASSPAALIREILAWVGSQAALVQQLCQQLVEGYAEVPIGADREAEEVAEWMQTHWIQDWQHQSAADHLKQIQMHLRAEDDKCIPLLKLYQQLLQRDGTFASHDPVLESLQALGLVEEQQIANRLYASVFDLVWVEQEIQQANQRRTICGRFKEIEKLKSSYTSQTYQAYLVLDKHLKNKSCLLREYTPLTDDPKMVEQTRYAIHKIFRDLEKLKGHEQIPEVLNLEDSGKFYITQEFVEGETLDQELQPQQPWAESRVIELLIDILSVLEFVHLQNLAHLNLKPANLLRRQQDGKIVLIDFAAFQEVNQLLERSSSNRPADAMPAPQYIPPTYTETRSAVGRDLYAVGMIGIQAMTGILPEQLSIDPVTREVIWLYDILPNYHRASVSPPLAEMLSKLIRHRTDEQYTSSTEVLQQLQVLKQPPELVPQPTDDGRKQKFAWLTHKRTLAWGGVGIAVAGMALGVLGASFFQRISLAEQQRRSVEQKKELCYQPIRVQINGSSVDQTPDKEADKAADKAVRLINQSAIIAADQVITACEKMIERQPNDFQAFESQGKANLLLWKLNQLLGDSETAQEKLSAALQQLTKATESSQPQPYFYLGLAQSFQAEKAQPEQEASYRKAIDLYIQSKSQGTPADLPLLINLIAFLIRSGNLTPEDYSKTIALFDRAEDLASDSSSNALKYNSGSARARAGSYPDALRIFKELTKASPDNFDAWRSQGFAHVLQGQSEFKQARAAFEKAVTLRPKDRLTKNYLTLVKTCLSTAQGSSSQCNLNALSRDSLKGRFEDIFPIFPIYTCEDYPVLGIAESGKQYPLCSGLQQNSPEVAGKS